MEFRILGPLEVHGERGPLALGPIKPRAVLAVLLLHPNQPVSADRLALALWGHEAPADATRTVQVYVSRLRKGLGDPEAIATTPAGYRLRVRPGELDAERFARGVEAGRRALAAGRLEQAGGLLRDALGLWRGPPLAELEFEPFAQVEIARLGEQRLAALEARVDADLAMGRHAALIGELQGLVAEHPTRERLAAELMLALYRSGRQAEALEVYRDARHVLVEQVGVEPGPELQRLQEAVLDHDASLELPPARGDGLAPLGAEAARGLAAEPQAQPAASRLSALPRPPNRTIGRAREVGAVAERLRAEHVRLLTLIGPGGVGKTRLAVEAARTVEADFADGAGFVRLAAVARGEAVAGAIMSALAIVPLAGESVADAVERFLAVKQLLLVIDNCEHLPDAAPWIGALVAACPELTVLATSREPLSVQAEHTHPVPPLALPACETPRAALANVAAVELFCDRARARDTGFDLDAGNAAAVGEICRRVDGLPLAIELAAARCGLLSPGEIAERLDAVIGSPGTAPRDAPARQQTLRATIDWSHELLSAPERDCFTHFAVFCGGATMEAAEAITGAGIDTLDRLVAKSLLIRRDIGGRTRLGMLETIRTYAAERLTTVAAEESVRERHYRYFLWLAQRHANDPALCGPSIDQHLAFLVPENENLRAALEWAARRDDEGPLLELSVALIEYHMRRDHYLDAVSWIELALHKTANAGDPKLRVRALSKLPWPLWALGRAAEEAPLLSEAEAIARTLADPATIAEALYNRAAIMSLEGQVDMAAGLADEALAYATAAGDPWLVAMASWSRLMAARSADELRDRVEQTASLLKDAGNVYHHASVFQMVGYSLLCRGCDDEAKRYLQRAVPLVRQLNQPYLWASLRQKAGLAALFTGDTDAARLAFCEQLAICRQLVIRPAASRGLAGLAAIATLQDDLDRGARLSGAAGAHRYGDHQDAVDARLRAAFSEPARARFGADAWDAAVHAGAALDFQDAIAYALEEPRYPHPTG